MHYSIRELTSSVHGRKANPGQLLGRSAVVVALVIAAGVARLLATSPALDWPAVGRWLFSPVILAGVVTTVELTVVSQLLAIAVGVVIALLASSPNPVSAWAARAYVWFFRSVPLLVQLIAWYNIAIVVPSIRLTLIGVDVPTNTVISGCTAAILGLGLHEAAYMAEIIRAGVMSVPRSQLEAAMDLGLSRGQAMRRAVLPQALRVIIPPTGNQFVGLLKASALVAAIGGGDLLTRAEYVYGQNFQVIPLLTVATIWYLALVSVFSALQHLLEARLSRHAP
jgi:polar amino acid transport system permease protein